MKIEIGESLILSWLRHAKGCQLVQMNWKPSVTSWTLNNEDVIQKLMDDSGKYFKEKYGYEIYKKTTSLDQLIRQAEIDVLGSCYGSEPHAIYGIDVAFHEGGLLYGSKKETAARVVKKLLRTAMCIYGYFNHSEGEIIFASPKIHNAVYDALVPCMKSIEELLRNSRLNFRVRLLANGEFEEKILLPVLKATSDVADTSELFMRSIQMYNMFSGNKKNRPVKTSAPIPSNMVSEIAGGKVVDAKGLEEMKIGVLVRTTLKKMFENNEVSPEEVEKMQTATYSKETFDIQYPLLRKTSLSDGKTALRYWAEAIEIYGDNYFICSEWFENNRKNNRPYFMKWLSSFLVTDKP